MSRIASARLRVATAVLVSVAVVGACTPSSEGRHNDLQRQIGDEMAALVADRPITSISYVSPAEIQVVVGHLVLLNVYADNLEMVPVEADLQTCRDDIVRTTRAIVDGGVVELINMGPAYGEMLAVLKLC